MGYEIDGEDVRPGKAKIQAVAEFKQPKNVHEVRQFIGLASYFRKFIKNFALLARPLTVLTKKNESWTWGNEQTQAFEEIKTNFAPGLGSVL